MKEHYKTFKKESLELIASELERLRVEFDEDKEYSKDELSELIVRAEKDHQKLSEWLKEAGDQLRELWNGGDPPDQKAINDGYHLIQKSISARKGSKPEITIEKVEEISEFAFDIDNRVEKYCGHRFTYYRPQFGGMEISRALENTLNLRINDSFLKYEAFFAASSATFLHLLRNTCSTSVGLLSRLILSRSLFETAIHNYFIIFKLNAIAIRIKTKQTEKSIEEIELFNNQFLKGMYGSKSPVVGPEAPIPYNILTCIECLKKNPIAFLTYEFANEFYGHLCDFTHPNYLMRYALSNVEPAKGDYFSYEIVIDKSFEGKSKAPQLIETLLNTIYYSLILINESFQMIEETRELLNNKNQETFGDDSNKKFNMITGDAWKKK